MQVLAIAIAVSVVIGGALGAGATSIALSSNNSTPSNCTMPASRSAEAPFQRIPTTGSKGF